MGSSEYKAAIIDMDTLDVDYVMYKDILYEDRARGRQVEWAEGTKYVWIGGREQDEVYVIDIETKTLVRTITDIEPRKILSVTHHAFNEMADEYASYYANQNILSADKESSETTSSGSSSSKSDSGSATIVMAQGSAESDEDEGANALSIWALALSCVAIAAVVASLFVNKASSGAKPSGQETAALTGKPKVDDPSLAVPPSV